MPDGDRFERKLRGKGWRSVYRLGCSSAPVEAVVDKIMSAAAHLFRSQDTKVVREVFQELQDASQLRAKASWNLRSGTITNNLHGNPRYVRSCLARQPL